MTCSDCRSDNVYRVARKGLMDAIRYHLAGDWPWRCARCGHRFYSSQREKPQVQTPAQYNGVPVEMRRWARKQAMTGNPAAAILLRTDTEEQLSQILVSLAAAVERTGARVEVGPPSDALKQQERSI